MRGFLQGDSYSPVGFCIFETPVCRLLQQSRGYRICPSGSRDVRQRHSLFVNDLKVYQESHEILLDVSEVIVHQSHNTGVSKCAEIVFECGKMVSGEGLKVLEERINTMDPDENKIHKFLGIEQEDGIKTKTVFERVKGNVNKRVKMLTNNNCKFTGGELKELDQVH